jgi:hypothetical protein
MSGSGSVYGWRLRGNSGNGSFSVSHVCLSDQGELVSVVSALHGIGTARFLLQAQTLRLGRFSVNGLHLGAPPDPSRNIEAFGN